MNDKFKEVIEISSTIPSIYVHSTYFSMFDQRTKGLGMNFLSKIYYEGGDWGLTKMQFGLELFVFS